MLKLGRVTKVKVFFLVLITFLILANFNFFEFSATILEKGSILAVNQQIWRWFTWLFVIKHNSLVYTCTKNPTKTLWQPEGLFTDLDNQIVPDWGNPNGTYVYYIALIFN